MKINKQIDTKLKEIYEEFRKDKGDLTGWSLMQKLKAEAGFEEGLTNLFVYRIYKLSYKKKEIINIFSLLTELLSYPYNEEERIRLGEKNHNEEIEFSPNLFFRKGIKTQILENLELNKTLKAYYHHLICIEEELDEKKILNKNQIKVCEYWNSALDEILKVFREEWNSIHQNSPRIIKIK